MNTSQDQTRTGGGSQPSNGDAQHLKEEAARLTDEARQQGRAQSDHYRDVAAGKVERVADSIKAAASELGDDDMGKLSHQITRLAEGMTTLSRGLREKSGDEILRDVGNLSRQNPALFVAGGIAIGFGLTRLMKATAAESGGSDDAAPWSQSQSQGKAQAADTMRHDETHDAGGPGSSERWNPDRSAAGSAQASADATSAGLGAPISGDTASSRDRENSDVHGTANSASYPRGNADRGSSTDESNGRKPQ